MAYEPPIQWDDFATRCLLLPTIVFVSILLIATPLHRLWEERRWGELPLVTMYIGSSNRTPERPHYLMFLFLLQILFSVTSSCTWVRRTYVQEVSAADRSIEIVVSIFFLLMFVVHMIRDGWQPHNLFKITILIDIYTVTPALLPGREDFWLSLLFMRVYNALDGYTEMERTGIMHKRYHISQFTRAVVMIVLRSICMIIALSGMIFTFEVLGEIPGFEDQFIETEMGPLSFVQMVYWIFTTISTVGYGDFAPKTIPSRLFACVAIVSGVTFFSLETASLMGLKALLETGQGKYMNNGRTPHVVVVGGGVSKFGPVLMSFFSELFSSDEAADWPEAVLMSQVPMDRGLKRHLSEELPQEVERRILYFVGTAMSKNDLQRVKTDKAAMVFVIADATATDPDEEDGHNLLRALSIMRRYPDTKIRLMMLLPESKERATGAGIAAERCFSINEIKSNLLAHCCRCRGFLTLVSNLLDSEKVNREELGDEHWHEDYVNGTNAAVHGFIVRHKFAKMPWRALSKLVFSKTGAILCAAQLDGRVTLNPGGIPDAVCEGGEVAFASVRDLSELEEFSEKEDWKSIFRANRRGKSKNRMLRGSTTSQGEIGLPSKPKIPETKDCSNFSVRTGSMLEREISETHQSSNNEHEQPQRIQKKRDRHEVQHQQRVLADILTKNGEHIALISCSQREAPWKQITAFLKPLRSKSRRWEHRPIIVLTAEDPPLQLLMEYEDVAFLKGSVLLLSDLEAYHIPTAAEIVMFAGDRPAVHESHQEDCNCVVVAFTLDALLKSDNLSAFIMYELHSASSANFLPQLENADEKEEDMSPPTSSSPLTRAKSMLTGDGEPVTKEADKNMLRHNARFASGQVFTQHFLGMMLGREYYVPSTIELLESLVMPARHNQSSYSWQLRVPEDMVGRTVSELFDVWMEEGAVVLGLYRPLFPNSNSGPNARLGYVVAQPDPELRLTDADNVFVLAPPEWAHNMLAQEMNLTPDGEPVWRAELYAAMKNDLFQDNSPKNSSNEHNAIPKPEAPKVTEGGNNVDINGALDQFLNEASTLMPLPVTPGSTSQSQMTPHSKDRGQKDLDSTVATDQGLGTQLTISRAQYLKLMSRLQAAEAGVELGMELLRSELEHLGEPLKLTNASGSRVWREEEFAVSPSSSTCKRGCLNIS